MTTSSRSDFRSTVGRFQLPTGSGLAHPHLWHSINRLKAVGKRLSQDKDMIRLPSCSLGWPRTVMAQRVMVETTQLIDELLSTNWKELLRRQLAPDPKEQSAANHDLWKAINESHDGRSKDLWVNAQDVPRLIQIGMAARFPLPRGAFTSAENHILGWFWKVQHPSIVPAITELYKHAQLRAKMDALVILTAESLR